MSALVCEAGNGIKSDDNTSIVGDIAAEVMESGAELGSKADSVEVPGVKDVTGLAEALATINVQDDAAWANVRERAREAVLEKLSESLTARLEAAERFAKGGVSESLGESEHASVDELVTSGRDKVKLEFESRLDRIEADIGKWRSNLDDTVASLTQALEAATQRWTKESRHLWEAIDSHTHDLNMEDDESCSDLQTLPAAVFRRPSIDIDKALNEGDGFLGAIVTPISGSAVDLGSSVTPLSSHVPTLAYMEARKLNQSWTTDSPPLVSEGRTPEQTLRTDRTILVTSDNVAAAEDAPSPKILPPPSSAAMPSWQTRVVQPGSATIAAAGAVSSSARAMRPPEAATVVTSTSPISIPPGVMMPEKASTLESGRWVSSPVPEAIEGNRKLGSSTVPVPSHSSLTSPGMQRVTGQSKIVPATVPVPSVIPVGNVEGSAWAEAAAVAAAAVKTSSASLPQGFRGLRRNSARGQAARSQSPDHLQSIAASNPFSPKGSPSQSPHRLSSWLARSASPQPLAQIGQFPAVAAAQSVTAPSASEGGSTLVPPAKRAFSQGSSLVLPRAERAFSEGSSLRMPGPQTGNWYVSAPAVSAAQQCMVVTSQSPGGSLTIRGPGGMSGVVSPAPSKTASPERLKVFTSRQRSTSPEANSSARDVMGPSDIAKKTPKQAPRSMQKHWGTSPTINKNATGASLQVSPLSTPAPPWPRARSASPLLHSARAVLQPNELSKTVGSATAMKHNCSTAMPAGLGTRASWNPNRGSRQLDSANHEQRRSRLNK